MEEYAPLKYVSCDLPPIFLMIGSFEMNLRPARRGKRPYGGCFAGGYKDACLVLGEYAHCDIHYSSNRLMQNFIVRRGAEIDGKA